jgi:DNA helicase-2/ATP-dependent DNA helicase PcrA
LFRASHHSGPLEVELTRRNIPFVKFGGLKFLEAAHIKDMLAFLRWAENSRDRVAGFRVVQLLPGAGPATAAKILDRVGERADPLVALGEHKPPAAASEHWPAFVETLRLVRARAAGWPAELDLVRLWYEPHLERIHDDAILRQPDLLQLVQIASTYPSRERFLTELTLDPPDATSDRAGDPLLDEDYLILSTIHSAKGQEWKSVFILNAVDGCLPSDLSAGTSAEIEEERRLLYVGMTRARDNLHIVVPQRFFVHSQRAGGDRHMYASRTRFIPAALLDRFESCAWPRATSARAAAKPARGTIDISGRVRRTWG